ncbi:MAG: hypothetical protein OQL19_06560 [Gammaproteobacteria bacterium]|nr:hypothetical protein [Gammaproteobacteria bacterium]
MKLIWDNNHFKVTINKIDIYISPKTIPPFPIDAIVEEQDTSLVLQPEDTIHELNDDKPLWYFANTKNLLEEHQLGDVLIKSHNPIRFICIVHDLEQSPSWCSKWIETALKKVFELSNEKSLSILAIPIFGTQFSRFQLEEFISVFVRVLKIQKIKKPRKIWLISEVGINEKIFQLLEKSKK